MTIIPATQKESEQIRPIQFLEIGKLKMVPAPFLRIATCGLLSIEVIEEVIDGEQPLARYVSFASDQLRGRGPAPALLLLKLLLSSPKLLLSNPERFASKDWLIQQFCRDRELFSNVRLDNIASQLRSLLCPDAYEGLRTHLVAHVRSSPASGDGYQLAAYPLIWTDIDALAWNMEQGARMERFGDDPLPSWERAYALVKRGIYLPDELYSDWATTQREEMAGALRQCVQALARLYIARYGEAGEEEALLLLRSYWLEHPREEDVLRPLMELLGQRECYQEALDYYQRLCGLLDEPHQPDPRTRDVAEYVRTKQIQRRQVEKDTSSHSALPTAPVVPGTIEVSLEEGEQEANVSLLSGAFAHSRPTETLFPLSPADGTYSAQRKPKEDHRHLVGRDDWIHTMQAYLSADLPKKLVIVQAALGAGKSSAFHLLRRSLAEQGAYRLFFFTCAVPVRMTAEEHLDRFLAELFVFLGIPTQQFSDGPTTYTQRVRELFACLAQLEQPMALFVDNGEVLLQEDGQLAVCWQQWFTDLIHYQHRATLFLAAREWPGWKGRNRVYVAQYKLPPLSPEAGAAIWRRMGYTDVEEALLQQVSARCGGNPWLIELRASTLLDELYDTSGQNDDPRSQATLRTQLLQKLVQEPHVFGNETDRETKRMLQEVISTRLSSPALSLLEILAGSPLPLPLSILTDALPEAEEAFEALQHASLVDRDAMLSLRRARLHPVVVESAYLHQLARPEHRDRAEEIVIQVYTRWREQGIEDEQEKAAVTAELIIFDLNHQRFLAAAERLIQSNMSLARFGHTLRIARFVSSLLEHTQWYENLEQECGAILLRYYLAPVLGQKISTAQLALAYQPLYEALLQQKIHLQVPTELAIVRQLFRARCIALCFAEAQEILDQAFIRHPDLEQTHPYRYASLLGKRAEVLGAWSKYADEQKEHKRARELRQQAIAFYGQCINLWEQVEKQSPSGERSAYRYNQALYLNELAYYLRQQGQFGEALAVIERSLALETAGYAKPGSLAAVYGEKAQILAAQGCFREALKYDQRAVEQIQQEAGSGDSFVQSEVWVYFAERGQLYLRLGRLKEAEILFEQASSNMSDDRRSYKILAEAGQAEIQQWRQASPNEQLDWRWAKRYRELVHYDAFGWWTATAFSPEEEEEWRLLRTQQLDERGQKRIEELVIQSRDREILAALSEGREPCFQYPRIPIVEIRDKIEQLQALAEDITREEPNAVVRRLYLDVVKENLLFLQMIRATSEGDTQAFQRFNGEMFPVPTSQEMERALWHVAQFIALGRQRADLAEISEEVFQFLQRIHAPLPSIPVSTPIAALQNNPSGPVADPRMVSPRTIQRFFEAVIGDYGFDGWHVVIDSTISAPYIESFVQCIFLPDQPRSLTAVREMLSHEIESHVFRAVSGAKSQLDLLGTGTAFYMATEEGLAEYYDQKTAAIQGKMTEEFNTGSLQGILATGLACGVVTDPLTFSQVYRFFERFLVLQWTIKGLSKTVEKARTSAPRSARTRCLRTFRGVPDLTKAGVAYTQDVLYYRGLQQVTAAIQQNPQVLTRLMVGKVGLEQLDDLAELDITEPPSQPRWLAHNPDLDAYILSFEAESKQP